jgi:hypothetical protein
MDRQLRCLVPFRRTGQHPHGLDRLELARRHYGKEIAVADHLDDARHLGDSVDIRRPELCAIARWAHDAGM